MASTLAPPRSATEGSHSFLCEGVTIENDVFIGHNVTFINDLYPRAANAGGVPLAATLSETGDGNVLLVDMIPPRGLPRCDEDRRFVDGRDAQSQ